MTELHKKEKRFIDLYKSIDVNALQTTEYVKNYIVSYQDEIESVVQRYMLILKEVIKRKGKFIQFMDFGGGTGILSLLAKFIGIKNVVYVDISEEMKEGALQLSRFLNISIDDFFVWDYSSEEGFAVTGFDVIMNYDVLEHLYNPLEAFIVLKKYLKDDGIILMASGANTYNPVIKFLYSKKHIISEFYGTTNGKEIDAKESFYKIRKRIIEKHFPELNEEKCKKYALLTRGLRKEDIITAVNLHINHNTKFNLPYLNNTCDPFTGNWDEHLIEYFDLQERLKDFYKEVTLKCGYYPVFAKRNKFKKAPIIKDENIIKKIYPYLKFISEIFGKYLNIFIKILPKPLNFMIAPFYILMVENPKSDSNSNSEIKEIYDKWEVWQNSPKIDINKHYTPSQSLKKLLSFVRLKRMEDKSFLDAGCGNGAISRYLQSKNFDVFACDISPHAKDFVQNFSLASIENLPYKDNSFDVVFSFSVIHHLDNPQKAISEIKRVLKPNGYLITTQHTRFSFWTLWRRVVLKRLESYSHLNYIKFDSAKNWINRFRDNGFELIDSDGIQLSILGNFFADIWEKLVNLEFNPFAIIDEKSKKLLKREWVREISYHSLLIFRNIK